MSEQSICLKGSLNSSQNFTVHKFKFVGVKKVQDHVSDIVDHGSEKQTTKIISLNFTSRQN